MFDKGSLPSVNYHMGANGKIRRNIHMSDSKFFLMFKRERQSVSRGRAERARRHEREKERDRQNLKQTPSSEMSAQSPKQGSNP